MIVLRRFVADRKRSFAGWSVAACFLVLLTVAFYPTIRAQPSLVEAARDLPDAVKATFGIDDAIPLSSPAGYLHGRMFSLMMPLMLVIFGISAGARAIGGSEEDGDLELLLAQPVTRARVLAERGGAVALLTVGLGMVSTALLLTSAPVVGALEGLPVAWVLGSAAGAVSLGLLHAAIAFTVGAVTGRRSTAVAAGATVAGGGYLLQGLLAAAGSAEAVRMVSPWHWFLRRNMLAEGVDWFAFVLPAVVVGVLAVVAAAVFTRRDLR